MAEGLPVERLRAYLQDLGPEARALLVAELERAQLRGDALPGADLILAELRPALRRGGREPLRIGNPARLFFRPVEPFLIDHRRADLAPPWRIERRALGPIWEWLCRDLMPEPAKAYSDQVTALLLSGDERGAEPPARTFQDLAAQRIEGVLAQVEEDEKARRRLGSQIGGPHALRNLQALLACFRHRGTLTLIGARLPPHIRNLADGQLENVATLLQTNAAANTEALTFALALVADRLALPWQVIRLAVESAESDVAARVMAAPLGPAVTFVFGEMRDAIAELRAGLKEGRIAGCVLLLKDLHDAVRGLRTELDLSGDCAWGRELAALRAAVSGLLQSEIEAIPGRLRRLLRPPGLRDTGGTAALDQQEVAETEARVALVEACRNYAGELALNQIAPRVHAELQNYFDTNTSTMLEGLRAAGQHDRQYRQSQIDAAVRFSGKLFGAEYAGLLAKAAAAAAAGERKAAAKG